MLARGQSTLTWIVDREDIDALLEDAEEHLGLVRRMYDETLREQEVPRKLMTRIKNVVEHQRSALEYLANAIYAQVGDGGGKRSSYPVATGPSQFAHHFE